jgi:hypothetical protein
MADKEDMFFGYCSAPRLIHKRWWQWFQMKLDKLFVLLLVALAANSGLAQTGQIEIPLGANE